MTGVRSVGQMLEKLEGLTDTTDVSAWENKFIKDNLRKYRDAGKSTSGLSDAVVEKIEELHDKHYG